MEIQIFGRARFLAIFRPKAFEGADKKDPKYRATVIFDINSESHQIAEKALIDAAFGQWKENYVNVVPTIERSKKFLRNGNFILRKDKSVYPEFAGKLCVAATSLKRPNLFDRDGKTFLLESDGKLYDGAYVMAIVDVYARDKPGEGCSINAELRAMQFVQDGDAFSGGPPIAPGTFRDLSQAPGAVAPPPTGAPAPLY